MAERPCPPNANATSADPPAESDALPAGESDLDLQNSSVGHALPPQDRRRPLGLTDRAEGGTDSSLLTTAERDTGSTSQSTVDPASSPSTVLTPSGIVDLSEGSPPVIREALDRRTSPTSEVLSKEPDKRFGQKDVLIFGQKIKKGRNLCPTNRTNMGDLFPGEDEQHARALALLAKFPDAVTPISEREWRVRSASGRGYYRVSRTRKSWMCECPSATSVAPARCKHAIAVII